MNMKHLYTTLESAVSSGSVTDETITNDSVIEIYFDNNDILIKSQSQNEHTVYFTVDGNVNGTNVCVVVNNLSDVDISEITQEISSNTQDIEDLFASQSTMAETLEQLNDAITSHSGEIINLRGDVGDIENDIAELDTRVDDCFTSVSSGKTLIASAITDKGVTTLATDTFSTMATNIGNIRTSLDLYKFGNILLDKPITDYIPNININNAFAFKRIRNGNAQYIFIWTTYVINWTINQNGLVVSPSVSSSYMASNCSYDETTHKLNVNSTTSTSSTWGYDPNTRVTVLYAKGMTFNDGYIY